METCEKCGRLVTAWHTSNCEWLGVYAEIEHGGYGCESGCCGHWIYVFNEHGHEVSSAFEFTHPNGMDKEEFCKMLAASTYPGVPIRIEESDVSDD